MAQGTEINQRKLYSIFENGWRVFRDVTVDTKNSDQNENLIYSSPCVILLYGKSGCGKTLCVNALCEQWKLRSNANLSLVHNVQSIDLFKGNIPWLKSECGKSKLFVIENIDDLCRDLLKVPLSEASSLDPKHSGDQSAATAEVIAETLTDEIHSESYAILRLIESISVFSNNAHENRSAILLTVNNIESLHPWILSKVHQSLSVSDLFYLKEDNQAEGKSQNSAVTKVTHSSFAHLSIRKTFLDFELKGADSLQRWFSFASLHDRGKENVNDDLESIPDISWNRIVGQGPAIKKLKNLVENCIQYRTSQRDSHTWKETLCGNVLLYGLPGTGKTLLAKATASALGASFRNLRLTEIIRPEIGHSENILATFFNQVKSDLPAVVFIDEVESLFTQAESSKQDCMQNLLNLLLYEMDSIYFYRLPVHIISATNTPHRVNKKFFRRGRFDQTLHILPPSASEIQKYISESKNHVFSGKSVELMMQKLQASFSESTHFDPGGKVSPIQSGGYTGYTIVDIDSLCRSLISISAVRVSSEDTHRETTHGDGKSKEFNGDSNNFSLAIQRAIEMTKPSYNALDLSRLMEWEDEF